MGFEELLEGASFDPLLPRNLCHTYQQRAVGSILGVQHTIAQGTVMILRERYRRVIFDFLKILEKGIIANFEFWCGTLQGSSTVALGFSPYRQQRKFSEFNLVTSTPSLITTPSTLQYNTIVQLQKIL